jgi:hypothetical protein
MYVCMYVNFLFISVEVKSAISNMSDSQIEPAILQTKPVAAIKTLLLIKTHIMHATAVGLLFFIETFWKLSVILGSV